MRWTLVPPIPKALTPARRRRPVGPGQGSADPDTRNGPSAKAILGLAAAKPTVGGISPRRTATSAVISPATPAAASRWPTAPLDRPEDHAVWRKPSEDTVQRGHLNHVTNCRCSAVCFDKSNFRWTNPGIIQRLSNGGSLSVDRRGGEGRLLPHRRW